MHVGNSPEFIYSPCFLPNMCPLMDLIQHTSVIWAGLALTVQAHRLILHNISFFRLNKEMWQRFRWVRWKGFWEFMKKVLIWQNKEMKCLESHLPSLCFMFKIQICGHNHAELNIPFHLPSLIKVYRRLACTPRGITPDV